MPTLDDLAAQLAALGFDVDSSEERVDAVGRLLSAGQITVLNQTWTLTIRRDGRVFLGGLLDEQWDHALAAVRQWQSGRRMPLRRVLPTDAPKLSRAEREENIAHLDQSPYVQQTGARPELVGAERVRLELSPEDAKTITSALGIAEYECQIDEQDSQRLIAVIKAALAGGSQ